MLCHAWTINLGNGRDFVLPSPAWTDRWRSVGSQGQVENGQCFTMSYHVLMGSACSLGFWGYNIWRNHVFILSAPSFLPVSLQFQIFVLLMIQSAISVPSWEIPTHLALHTVARSILAPPSMCDLCQVRRSSPHEAASSEAVWNCLKLEKPFSEPAEWLWMYQDVDMVDMQKCVHILLYNGFTV